MQEKLEKILRQVAVTENITNYQVYTHINAVAGDGFLSECFTGEVLNKDTGLKIQAYVKICPSKSVSLTANAYSNECDFYSKIFPELIKFQIEKGVLNPFQNIPKFYCGADKEDDSYIAMENLKVQDYVMVDKTVNIKKDHLKIIFETYGKYHALSFAFKEQNLERYLELTNPLKDTFGIFIHTTKHCFIQAYNAIKDENIGISKKIEPMLDNLEETITNFLTYKGKYSALCHGDCWSNNMLFKFQDNGQLEDIKLLDFQLCRDSTPIHDLSYFFYSGASKEDFDKLDEYLELYHKSFSAYAKLLGSDPEKLLPLNEFKKEWKQYGLFGIFLGVMVWELKLIPKEIVEEFARTQDNEVFREATPLVLRSEIYKKNISNIFTHIVEYGII